jgi:hypothetical protein
VRRLQLRCFPGGSSSAGKHIPLQTVNNNQRTHGFSSLGKKLEQSTTLAMFLEGHFKNEARCSLHSGRFEVYLI